MLFKTVAKPVQGPGSLAHAGNLLANGCDSTAAFLIFLLMNMMSCANGQEIVVPTGAMTSSSSTASRQSVTGSIAPTLPTTTMQVVTHGASSSPATAASLGSSAGYTRLEIDLIIIVVLAAVAILGLSACLLRACTRPSTVAPAIRDEEQPAEIGTMQRLDHTVALFLAHVTDARADGATLVAGLSSTHKALYDAAQEMDCTFVKSGTTPLTASISPRDDVSRFDAQPLLLAIENIRSEKPTQARRITKAEEANQDKLLTNIETAIAQLPLYVRQEGDLLPTQKQGPVHAAYKILGDALLDRMAKIDALVESQPPVRHKSVKGNQVAPLTTRAKVPQHELSDGAATALEALFDFAKRTSPSALTASSTPPTHSAPPSTLASPSAPTTLPSLILTAPSTPMAGPPIDAQADISAAPPQIATPLRATASARRQLSAIDSTPLGQLKGVLQGVLDLNETVVGDALHTAAQTMMSEITKYQKPSGVSRA